MATTTLRKVGQVAPATNGNSPVPAQTSVQTSVRELGGVPEISVYHAYEGRSFGSKTEMEIFEYAREHGVNVLIEGPTGDGKTMASMAYAAKEGIGFYSVPCNVGVDPAQLFGKWIVGDAGQPEWIDGGITHMVRNGGLLLINEGNAMPAKVAMVMFSLLDHRREITLLDHKAETVRAHKLDGCWCGTPRCRRALVIVMDMNPGYAGTANLNQAFRNRFPIQLNWDYDPVVEAKLVKSKCLQNNIVKGLRKQFKDGTLDTPTSTNMLIEFEQFVRDMGLEFAVANFVNHYAEDARQAVSLVFATFADNLAAEYLALEDQGPDNPHDDHLVLRDPTWIYTQEGGRA